MISTMFEEKLNDLLSCPSCSGSLQCAAKVSALCIHVDLGLMLQKLVHQELASVVRRCLQRIAIFTPRRIPIRTSSQQDADHLPLFLR